MDRMLSDLQNLSEEFNVAIFVTNQVMGGPQMKPVGGHNLAPASTTGLFLEKGKGDQRVCKVWQSPYIGLQQAVFQLSDGGITDPIN